MNADGLGAVLARLAAGVKLIVDEKNRIGLPAGNSRYTLRRLWLSRQEEAGCCYGLANNALWPLCHVVLDEAGDPPALARALRRPDWREANRELFSGA